MAPARMFDVLEHPAMTAAFAPYVAAHGPCALLDPNSLTSETFSEVLKREERKLDEEVDTCCGASTDS